MKQSIGVAAIPLRHPLEGGYFYIAFGSAALFAALILALVIRDLIRRKKHREACKRFVKEYYGRLIEKQKNESKSTNGEC